MVDNESSYWVGPLSDPNRFRLTHLLGSGGEGEVWRAVRPGAEDHEVAVKINAAPEGGSGEQTRLDALTDLRTKGLVRLHETFVGSVRHRLDDEPGSAPTHQYVVMDFVDGITLRVWLDEHPEAPPRQRLRILRGVAAALSDLHQGPRGRSEITHGDVKPANVIVAQNGKPVLVDLGLLRTAESGPASGHTAAYSSPELRNPDARPSPRADTFSFAVTAMETLTSQTPPLDADGNLDLVATRQRIAEAPALRWRPVLRRQLLRSLQDEPQERPPTPLKVFVGRTVALAVVPLLVLAGGSGTAIALQSGQPDQVVITDPGDSSSTPVSPSVLPPITMSALPSKKPTNGALPGHMLSVTLTGMTTLDPQVPILPGCAPATSNTAPEQIRKLRIWGGQYLSVLVSATKDVEILKIEPAIRAIGGPDRLQQEISIYCPTPTSSPTHVVEPPTSPSPCDPTKLPVKPYAAYTANVDTKLFRLLPDPEDRRPLGVSHATCAQDTSFDIDMSNCHENLAYGLTFTYRVVGTKKPLYTQTLGTYEFWGWARNATFVTTLDRVGVSNTYRYTGPPQGCGSSGQPYGSIDREVDRLLVKAVSRARHKYGLSHTAAIRQVAARAVTTERRVYDACSRAAAHNYSPNCGAPDRGEQRPALPTPQSPTATDSPTVIIQ